MHFELTKFWRNEQPHRHSVVIRSVIFLSLPGTLVLWWQQQTNRNGDKANLCPWKLTFFFLNIKIRFFSVITEVYIYHNLNRQYCNCLFALTFNQIISGWSSEHGRSCSLSKISIVEKQFTDSKSCLSHSQLDLDIQEGLFGL